MLAGKTSMMNDRIRELSAQAGYRPIGRSADDLTVLHIPDNIPETYIQKFAELIIKECARLCNDFDVYYADDSPLKREVALETAHDLADMILEHFEENI